MVSWEARAGRSGRVFTGIDYITKKRSIFTFDLAALAAAVTPEMYYAAIYRNRTDLLYYLCNRNWALCPPRVEAG
jgi:hypothetical protein